MKRRIATGIAGVGLLVLAACGSGSPKPATTANTAGVPTTAINAPASASAAVTAPDLTDVDNALASADSEIANAQRDMTNEGAPQ